MKRCGGGTVKDVIDTTKLSNNNSNNKGPNWVKALQFKDPSVTPPPVTPGSKLSSGPPNVTVLPSGVVKPSNPPPAGGERHLTRTPPSPHTPDHQSLMPYKRVDQVTAATAPAFKGVNNGLYHCLHCPFVGNSPAELKRHTRVHSDEKPFSCLTCGYSSKWKCDLKKHLRTYNHESAVSLDGKSDGTDLYSSDEQMQSPNESQGQTFEYPDEGSEDLSKNISATSPAKQLYKCNRCQYVTCKKNVLDSHMKIHGLPGQSKLNPGSNKLRCKQCDFEAEDLSSFLQHKLIHSSVQTPATNKLDREEEQVSPSSSSYTDEIDVMGSPTKHRRKPVKQFRCSRCPYTCFKRSGLEQHQSMHEPRGPGSLTCKYCDYNVYSRSLLGQHMKLHPEYLQEEGDESDEDESIPEEEQANEGILNLSNENNVIKNLSVFPGQTDEERCYPCEWCEVTFNQLSELYQHARAAHPDEYEQQEAAYSSVDSSTEDNGLLSPFYYSTSQGTDEINASESDGIGPEEDDGKKPKSETAKPTLGNGKRKRKILTCPDCGYTTDNSANLARHAIKHGQNAMYQCHYCNYSLNRQGLVIAHMKQVHGVTVTSLPKREDTMEEKITTVIPTEPRTDVHKKPQVCESSDMELVNVKGEMVFVFQVGNKKTYKCPKCEYTTANSSHCANHARQHGSKKRYSCEYCDYSLDKLPHIILHMKSAHSGQMNGSYQDMQEQKVQPLVLNINGLDTKKYPKRSHKTNAISSALLLKKTIKKNGQVKKKIPKMKSKLLKKALVRVFKGKKKNSAITKKNIKKRMSCSLCPYHTNNSGLLQNHLLQHNAPTS